ncbi:ceramidase, partial [Chytriomyces sp. MP71]
MVAFYPSATEGHWGLGTALTDWCEHNYAVTPYVAEFWNTVSNVFFLITVLAGIHNLRTIGVSERRDFLAFGSLLV